LFSSSNSRVSAAVVTRRSKSASLVWMPSAMAKTRVLLAGVPREKKSTSPLTPMAPSAGQALTALAVAGVLLDSVSCPQDQASRVYPPPVAMAAHSSTKR
jgi:hypothetical protein